MAGVPVPPENDGALVGLLSAVAVAVALLGALRWSGVGSLARLCAVRCSTSSDGKSVKAESNEISVPNSPLSVTVSSTTGITAGVRVVLASSGSSNSAPDGPEEPRKSNDADRKSTRLNSSHDQISYAV